MDFVFYSNLKRRVGETEAEIDRHLNPKMVQRVGPVELTLSLESPAPEWYAHFSYKFTRRANSQKISTRTPRETCEEALEELLNEVSLASSLGDI